jgi:hypothetical protein
MSEINSFRERIHDLIGKFEKDKTHYLSKGYPEAQVGIDFINPFFEALGWEITITDEKIDEIVYGLYGVTEEEKGIIEG